jgi:amidase
MKPTRGRVSTQPVAADWLGLSTFGALARTVTDSALMLDAMCGIVDGDRYAAPLFDGSYVDEAGQAPGRLRVAVSRKLPPGLIAKLSDDQRGALERTAALLGELGHDVIERDPTYGTGAILFTQTWLRGIYEASLGVPDRTRLERTTRRMAAAGRLVPEWRARRLEGDARTRATARTLGLWEHVDVLMTPVLATTAIAAEGGYGRSAVAAFNTAARFVPWTPAFNLTGQPAIAVPAGFGTDGLPLSVQLVGRLGAEAQLYSLAAQIEATAPWADRRPPIGAAAVGAQAS